MAVRSPHLNVMAKAAEKAGRALVRDFGEVENLQVSRKGPADFVSIADKKAERIVREELEKARPDFGFLLEEGGEVKGRDPSSRWIVDPLDGTTNFLHGIAHFAVSIALERDGEIVAGVIYEPIRDEMYWAEKGSGAFLNARRLRVSSRKNMLDAVIGTGIPFHGVGDHPTYATQLRAVMANVAGVRRFGSAALDLAYVAAGRFDGFWETGLHPWDAAAGILLIREAGGFVTEIGGGRDPIGQRSVLAANASLHLPLGKLLRDATERATKVAAARKAAES